MAKRRKTVADYAREWQSMEAPRNSQFAVPIRIPDAVLRAPFNAKAIANSRMRSNVRAPEDATTLPEFLTVAKGAARNLPAGIAETGRMLADLGKFSGEQAWLGLKDRFTGGDEAYQHLANSPTFNAMAAHAKKEPLNAALDWVPFVGDAKGVGDMVRSAVLARRQGDIEGAEAYEGGLLPSIAAGFIPEGTALLAHGIAKNADKIRGAAARGLNWAKGEAPLLSVGEHPLPVDPGYIEGGFSVRPGEAAPAAADVPAYAPSTLSIAGRARPVAPRLEGPLVPQGLPAPGPGLPPFASKPRGGQWWADKDWEGQFNNSPEGVARAQAGDLGYRFLEWTPEDDYDLFSMAPLEIPKEQFAVQDWLSRALSKYYKSDFGSPEDPLRSLAERGLHYDPEMTPERWQATVNSHLLEDPIQHILYPPNRQGGMPGAGSDLRSEAMVQMPWLAKLPVTDKVYGISGGGLDLSHFADEFANALNPEASGLPADLAVRPESLQRMTFPQAVERVGRINQFRARELARTEAEKRAETLRLAAQQLQDSPVTHVFKEYGENNPTGLRWVEMAPPKSGTPTNYDVEGELAKALKFEGDTMGHCVGGYCPDVMSGRSRIFSLRDAEGMPHVTIETKPPSAGIPPEVSFDLQAQAWDEANARAFENRQDWDRFVQDRRKELADEWRSQQPQMYRIAQIKGLKNHAPQPEFLPFVQDFVKSGQWSDVGDLRNTGLVKLPDGRYITQQQYDEGMTKAFGENAPELLSNKRLYGPDWFERNWADAAPHFEGFAVGGRVGKGDCACKHSLSVKG